MARLELHVDIDGPPGLVGAYFLPHRMTYWYGRDMNCQFEVERGADEYRAGQKVRISGRVAGREVSLVVVVTAYQRSSVLEWRFRDSYGVSGRQSWEIEPRAEGSRVRLRDEYELPGRIGRLWDSLVTRHAVRARDRRDLDRLKRLVEHRPIVA
ncbi:MAG TPA: SRPBCC family protein [Candidatus Acidoferrales bacterium]|nr:SRPBCC family protein [Candidatus Acidoferrales bacterium]